MVNLIRKLAQLVLYGIMSDINLDMCTQDISGGGMYFFQAEEAEDDSDVAIGGKEE